MISHFLEETRRLYTAASYLRNNVNTTFDDLKLFEIEVNRIIKIDNDTKQNYVYNIFQSESAIEQSKIKYICFKLN